MNKRLIAVVLVCAGACAAPTELPIPDCLSVLTMGGRPAEMCRQADGTVFWPLYGLVNGGGK